MKKLIFIVLIAMASCSKSTNTPQPVTSFNVTASVTVKTIPSSTTQFGFWTTVSIAPAPVTDTLYATLTWGEFDNQGRLVKNITFTHKLAPNKQTTQVYTGYTTNSNSTGSLLKIVKVDYSNPNFSFKF